MGPWRSGVAVAVGAAIGLLARAGLDAALPHTIADVAWSTIIINAVGSFLLAFLTSGPWTMRIRPWLNAGLGTGILGTFTTLSAISVSTIALFAAGKAAEALLTLAVSLVSGFGAAWLGLTAGGGWSARRSSRRAAPYRNRPAYGVGAEVDPPKSKSVMFEHSWPF